MRTLIAYSSKTGNTKKVAQAIDEALGKRADLVDIKDKPDPDDYDRVIVGFWADKARVNEEAEDFMKNLKGKVCGVFATCGVENGHSHQKDLIDYAVDLLESQGCKLIASFVCQGKIDPEITELFETFPEDHIHYMTDERRKRHAESLNHPDKEDLENAKKAFEGFLDHKG